MSLYRGGWLGVERVEIELMNREIPRVSWRWLANSLTLVYPRQKVGCAGHLEGRSKDYVHHGEWRGGY